MHHLATAQRNRLTNRGKSEYITAEDTGMDQAQHSETPAEPQLQNPYPYLSPEWQQYQAKLIQQEFYRHERY